METNQHRQIAAAADQALRQSALLVQRTVIQLQNPPQHDGQIAAVDLADALRKPTTDYGVMYDQPLRDTAKLADIIRQIILERGVFARICDRALLTIRLQIRHHSRSFRSILWLGFYSSSSRRRFSSAMTLRSALPKLYRPNSASLTQAQFIASIACGSVYGGKAP